MKRHASYEQALIAHGNWLKDQGISHSTAVGILQKIREMVVGFGPPATQHLPKPADGQLYYDCQDDNLYCFAQPKNPVVWMTGTAGWLLGSQHAARKGGLPVLEFFYQLEHAATTKLWYSLRHVGEQITGLRLAEVHRGVFVDVEGVPYPRANELTQYLTKQCRVLTYDSQPLLTMWYSSELIGSFVNVTYGGSCKQLTLLPESGTLLWNLLPIVR